MANGLLDFDVPGIDLTATRRKLSEDFFPGLSQALLGDPNALSRVGGSPPIESPRDLGQRVGSSVTNLLNLPQRALEQSGRAVTDVAKTVLPLETLRELSVGAGEGSGLFDQQPSPLPTDAAGAGIPSDVRPSTQRLDQESTKTLVDKLKEDKANAEGIPVEQAGEKIKADMKSALGEEDTGFFDAFADNFDAPTVLAVVAAALSGGVGLLPALAFGLSAGNSQSQSNKAAVVEQQSLAKDKKLERESLQARIQKDKALTLKAFREAQKAATSTTGKLPTVSGERKTQSLEFLIDAGVGGGIDNVSNRALAKTHAQISERFREEGHPQPDEAALAFIIKQGRLEESGLFSSGSLSTVSGEERFNIGI